MTLDEPRRRYRLEVERGDKPGSEEPAQNGGDQALSVTDSYGAAAMIVSIAPAAHGRPLLFGRFAATRFSRQERAEEADPDAA